MACTLRTAVFLCLVVSWAYSTELPSPHCTIEESPPHIPIVSDLETEFTKNYLAVDEVIKSIKQREGAGFIVARPFPTMKRDQVSPFLLLDHFGPVNYGPGEAKGAPWHPHRGFVTISYMLAGEMQHRDSEGNKGSLRAGDVQYMVAGSGIIHDEEPSAAMFHNFFGNSEGRPLICKIKFRTCYPPTFSPQKEKGGFMEGFQIWVNLPKKDKMTAPSYQDVNREKLTLVETEHYSARVIAGSALGVQGPVQPVVPIQYLDVHAKAGAELEFEVPAGFNAMAFVYRGEATFSDKSVKGQLDDLVLFKRSTSAGAFRVNVASADGVKFLFLAGQPLDEPMSRQGPFVMNTREEISQAYEDYQTGKFIRSKGKVISATHHDEEYDPKKATIV